MKKLLIPLLILLCVSACDFPDFRGVSNEPDYQYIFNGYVVIGNPVENYGDTILVYPDFDLEFVSQLGKTPKDSLYDIYVGFNDNIKVFNIDSSRISPLNGSFYLKGDTLQCTLLHSRSGILNFIIDDPDDNVFTQYFPTLTLSIKD